MQRPVFRVPALGTHRRSMPDQTRPARWLRSRWGGRNPDPAKKYLTLAERFATLARTPSNTPPGDTHAGNNTTRWSHGSPRVCARSGAHTRPRLTPHTHPRDTRSPHTPRISRLCVVSVQSQKSRRTNINPLIRSRVTWNPIDVPRTHHSSRSRFSSTILARESR
jgi:hypothetical protein